MAVTEQRHASRRRPAERWATYRFDPLSAWRRCREIDGWFDGAVLELYGFDPDDQLVGRPLFLGSRAVGSRADDGRSPTPRASVRGWVRLANGRLLVLVQLGPPPIGGAPRATSLHFDSPV